MKRLMSMVLILVMAVGLCTWASAAYTPKEELVKKYGSSLTSKILKWRSDLAKIANTQNGNTGSKTVEAINWAFRNGVDPADILSVQKGATDVGKKCPCCDPKLGCTIEGPCLGYKDGEPVFCTCPGCQCAEIPS